VRSLQRGSSTVVAGRVSSRHGWQSHAADDSREVSIRFPSAFTGRAVPSRGCRPRTIPLRRFLPDRHPPVWHAPLRFFDASRLLLFSFALQAPPCGSFVTGFLSAVTYQARRLFSRPGRTRLSYSRVHRRSWDLSSLRSLSPVLRVNDRVSTRSGPRAVGFGLLRREWFSSRLS